MTKIDKRELLLRQVRGENLDESVHYWIEYSLDIRGKITIWGGMDFLRWEAVLGIDDTSVRVRRDLRPIYEYHHCSPWTARIYQIEQELDDKLTDEALVEEFLKFREAHPLDGYGMRMRLNQLPYLVPDGQDDEEGILKYRPERDDEQEVLTRLLEQERKDILSLWGVDCPPDINGTEKYNRRLMEDKGQVSPWFDQEFVRLGGDLKRLRSR